MNTTVKSRTQDTAFQVEPILRKALIEAEQEHNRLQELFRLMGWNNLPDELKLAIEDDVAAMVDELHGNYSSCDPHVQKRRESVTYWVSCYRDGICSLKTAVSALQVKKL